MTRREQGSALLLALIVSAVVLSLGAASLNYARFQRMQGQQFLEQPRAKLVATRAAERGVTLTRLYADPRQAAIDRFGGPVFSETFDGDPYDVDFSEYDYYGTDPSIPGDKPVIYGHYPSKAAPEINIKVTLDSDLEVARWEVLRPN